MSERDDHHSAVAWTMIVPVKGSPNAKSRLGASLRQATAIALDTVDAALGVAAVVVVTRRACAEPFRALGARVVLDPGGGLNAAVAAGVGAAGDGPVAVLLGDLPALRADELRRALARAAQYPKTVLPDLDGRGTVLLTSLGTSRWESAFEGASATSHERRGYHRLEVPDVPGLRRDVDTRDHLAAVAHRVGRRTRAAFALGATR